MADKLKVDDLVKHLIIDGKKPEDLMMVYGFVGEGSKEDTWTLYLDPTLQTSVEILEEDILHSASVTRTHTALGGSILWIKNASSYLNRNTPPEQDALKYFQGDIYQQYTTQNQQTTCSHNNDNSGCAC